MSMMGLLVFMAVSQVATAGDLLFMFNDVEREARKRNAELRAYLDARLGPAEPRVVGTSESLRTRTSVSAAG